MSQPRLHTRAPLSAEAQRVAEAIDELDLAREADEHLRKARGRSGPGRAVVIVIALEDLTGVPCERGSHVQPPKVYAKKRAS